MSRAAKYNMLVTMTEDVTGIEVAGIDGPDEFLEFLDMLTAALPTFLVEFIRERVADKYQESMIRDSLMKYVLIYLDKANIQIPGFNELLGDDGPKITTTVH